ncbi:MAG: BON domain-containing protein [Gemmatimonadales bacterium]
MARKSGGKPKAASKGSGKVRGSGTARNRIKRNEDTSQLLERGVGPSEDEVIDPAVDSPSEITSEGGPGTDAAYRMGGPRAVRRGPPNDRIRGTGGDGGYSTLGGGVYPDEGSPDDAPGYGDWRRHSTGAGSGARGQEGLNLSEQRGGSERRIGQRRRPDAALAQELHEILTKDPELDATEIEVEVEGGAVTLRGVVDSSDARLLAEELVESVTGVREVHNNLKVVR